MFSNLCMSTKTESRIDLFVFNFYSICWKIVSLTWTQNSLTLQVVQLVPISVVQNKDLILLGRCAGYPSLQLHNSTLFDTTGTACEWISEQCNWSNARLFDWSVLILRTQSSDFLSISVGKYIDWVAKTHSWDKPSPHEATSERKAIPFPLRCSLCSIKSKAPLKTF